MIKKHVYFLILFASLLSCRKENTSWTSQWSFPILKDQLSLQNLVGDSLLKNDSSGCKLVYEKSLYHLKLSEYLKIPDTTISSQLAINFPSLNINPGTILSQTNVENSISIGDAQLKKIIVKKGEITINIKNPINTKTFYTLEIPSFTKDGIAVKQTLVAAKGSTNMPSSITSSLDLSGYTIDLSGVNNTTFNTIVTNLDVQLDPNGSVTKVTNQDITQMDIQISGIQIDYAQGYFGNLKIDASNTVSVDGLKKITNGKLIIPKASVTLLINNGCKIMAKGTISSLISKNTTNSSQIKFDNIQLNNPFFIAPATINNNNQLVNSQKTFNFDETNSNLIPFIENFGDQYIINYSFALNPYGNLSGGWDEFFPDSEIELYLKSTILLNINAQNLTFQDTLPLKLSTSNSNVPLLSGQLKLTCETNMPINSSVILTFLNENHKTIGIVSGTSEILGKSENSSENQLSTVYFNPTQSIISNLNTAKYVIVKTIFNSINSSYEIPINGFLNFQLSGDFQTNMRY